MKAPLLTLFHYKARQVRNTLRRRYFAWQGMRIQQGVSLGKITCEWPHKLALGRDCVIQDKVDFRFGLPFNSSNYMTVGNRVFIGRCCEFNISSRVIIGNDCLIASNTTLVDISHHTAVDSPINTQPTVHEDIVIGDDVWIGSRCVILKGVTIGKGSIIGAGSVVNKSIPEYQIWAGAPARFIRERK